MNSKLFHKSPHGEREHLHRHRICCWNWGILSLRCGGQNLPPPRDHHNSLFSVSLWPLNFHETKRESSLAAFAASSFAVVTRAKSRKLNYYCSQENSSRLSSCTPPPLWLTEMCILLSLRCWFQAHIQLRTFCFQNFNIYFAETFAYL